MTDAIAIILFILWAPHIKRRFFYYLYFWQLKSYRLDRSLVDIKKDKRIVFPRSSLFLLILLPVVILTFESVLSYCLIGLAWFVLSSHALMLFFKKRWKLPIFTKKIIVTFAGTIFLWFLLTFYFRQGIVLFIPLFEILLPVFVFFCFALVEIPASVAKRSLMNKAKKKRETFANLVVVGITGSYGKTSTKDLLYSLLIGKYGESKVLKTEKNINAEIGIAATVLNKLNKNHEIFICEMGAYKRGEIKTACDIVKPKIAVLTGINEQHMATQGSQENIIKSKYELIEALPEDGIAFLNGKNKYCRELYKKTLQRGIKASLYGEKAGVGTENLEGAAMVAKELGMDDEEIACASQQIENKFPGIKIKEGINGLKILDATYSANPEGVLAHLEYIKKFSGKKIIVMPCLIELGPASKEVHGRIGSKIAEVCDLGIITTQDRLKDLQETAGNKVLLIEDPGKIIERIKSFAGAGDTILLESRVPRKLINALLK